MTSDEIREFKDDMRRDAMEDSMHERKMRTNLQYALDNLGLSDIHSEIETLANRLSEYDWEMSTSDVIEALGEI